MKKTLPYILSVSLFVYLIIVFTFASAKLREVKCEGLQVVVDGTEENAFIDETEVLGIIKRGYGDIEGCNIVSVDKDSLEHILVRKQGLLSQQKQNQRPVEALRRSVGRFCILFCVSY
jgi:cell division protein FtsQ